MEFSGLTIFRPNLTGVRAQKRPARGGSLGCWPLSLLLRGLLGEVGIDQFLRVASADECNTSDAAVQQPVQRDDAILGVLLRVVATGKGQDVLILLDSEEISS